MTAKNNKTFKLKLAGTIVLSEARLTCTSDSPLSLMLSCLRRAALSTMFHTGVSVALLLQTPRSQEASSIWSLLLRQETSQTRR